MTNHQPTPHRSKRNTHRRTSTNDPRLLQDIMSMPTRDSLPQDGPETVFVNRPGGVMGISDSHHEDRRSAERKAWDARMADLQKRIKARDDADAKRLEEARKAAIQSRVAGRPSNADGTPVEEPQQPEQPVGQQPEQPAGQPQPGPKNGTPQKQPGKDPPLTRRGTRAPANPEVSSSPEGTAAHDTYVDGSPTRNKTETEGKLDAGTRNLAAVREANTNTIKTINVTFGHFNRSR